MIIRFALAMMTNLIECVAYFCLGLLPFVLIAWLVDHRVMQQQIIEADCKFEAIDPIRWEAGLPMSDKCKCFWKEASLEQIRKMKPSNQRGE